MSHPSEPAARPPTPWSTIAERVADLSSRATEHLGDTQGQVLIIDDDVDFGELLAAKLGLSGVKTACATSLDEGLRMIRSIRPDVVFLDVHMPDGNGLRAISDFRASASAPEIIIITGQGDPDGAEIAIRSGAWDYVQKGGSLRDYSLSLQRALQYRAEKQARTAGTRLVIDEIVGDHITLREQLDVVAQAAHSEASVLITGETGTGKELFARAIHNNSPRANRPFVVVDCAALPENIVESTLFGHVRGAFTGAAESRAGLIKIADGGTLFLDEVAEMPLELQKAFLRVLQERRFRPVGSRTEVSSDFRVIAATNQDPLAMIEEGTFRKDLYFRLCALSVQLPALRQRIDDLEALAHFHLSGLRNRMGHGPKRISPACIEIIRNYSWPGNVRELVNVLEAAMAAASGFDTLYPSHLPFHVRAQAMRSTTQSVPLATSSAKQDLRLPTLKEARQEAAARAERDYLVQLLELTGAGLEHALQTADVSRSHFYALLKKHKLSIRAT